MGDHNKLGSRSPLNRVAFAGLPRPRGIDAVYPMLSTKSRCRLNTNLARHPSLITSIRHVQKVLVGNRADYSLTDRKLDLLVRVRFENPLPDPPFPPKLLKVKTDISRLGEPAYLDQLAGSASLPMLLDSEMGMPIDLNVFDGVWDGNDASLNPALEHVKLEPADAALLAPLRILAQPNGTALAPNAVKPEVSWMRNSSYIQRKETVRRRAAAEAKQ